MAPGPGLRSRVSEGRPSLCHATRCFQMQPSLLGSESGVWRWRAAIPAFSRIPPNAAISLPAVGFQGTPEDSFSFRDIGTGSCRSGTGLRYYILCSCLERPTESPEEVPERDAKLGAGQQQG